MRLRFGIVLICAFTLVLGGCAAGTGGGGGGGGFGGAPALSGAAAGEAPVQNSQTRQAETSLGLAMVASEEVARGHYQNALAAAQQAISQDERNPLPWLQAGQAYIGLREYENADNALRRAEELRPAYRADVENAREQAWYDIYQTGADMLEPDHPSFSYEGAAEVFEEANIINDRRPEIRVVLGQIYLQLDEYDRSITNLTRALEIIRSDRIQQVDSATAVIWRDQADEIPPMLARAFMQAERFEEAVATIRPMLDEDPTNQAYARSLASIYNRLNLPDSMRAVFTRMDEAAGGNLSASDYYIIGTSFHEAEDWAGADTYFEAALGRAPRHRDAAEWLARTRYYALQDLQIAGGDVDPAVVAGMVEAAESWVALDPNSYVALTMLATALNMADTDEDRLLDVVDLIETLPFSVDNLELQHNSGGGTVFADVLNRSMDAGQVVSLRFVFYGANGQQIGTQDAQLTLSAQDATSLLRLEVQASQPIEGYTYTVVTTP